MQISIRVVCVVVVVSFFISDLWNISRAAEQASPRQDLCVLWIWIASRANGVRQQAAAQLKSNTTVSSRSCGMSSSRFWIYRAYYKLFIWKMPTFPLLSSEQLSDHHRRFSFHFECDIFPRYVRIGAARARRREPIPKVRYAQMRLELHCISSTDVNVSFTSPFHISMLGNAFEILHSFASSISSLLTCA